MKPRSFLLTFLLICLLCIFAVVSLYAHRSDATSVAAAQESTDRGPVRMIRFVLSEDGIYPRTMRIDKGLVNIALEDRTKGSEGLLIESVVDQQRTPITQIPRAEKHWRGRTLVRLTPGRYLISDASQPDHQAELTVNP